MNKHRVEKTKTQKPKPPARGKQYSCAHGKVVDWAVQPSRTHQCPSNFRCHSHFGHLYRKRNRTGCHELPAVQSGGAGCTADAFTYYLVNVGRVGGIENVANQLTLLRGTFVSLFRIRVRGSSDSRFWATDALSCRPYPSDVESRRAARVDSLSGTETPTISLDSLHRFRRWFVVDASRDKSRGVCPSSACIFGTPLIRVWPPRCVPSAGIQCSGGSEP